MSKRKRALRSLSANECGAGIYAEPILSPYFFIVYREKTALDHPLHLWCFGWQATKLKIYSITPQATRAPPPPKATGSSL